MQFNVEREALFSALSRARAIIEPRNTIAILSNVRIVARDKRIEVRGTDLDSQVDAFVDADVGKAGDITVPAGICYDIVKTLPKKAVVSFELGADHQMVVKSGRARFKLPTLPTKEYPDMDVGAFSHTFECERSMLEDLFGRTRFAISTEETRYYLNGGYFHSWTGEDGPELRVCATDGHRLAMVSRPAPVGADGMRGVIVPMKTVASVLSMSAGKETIGVSVSDSKIRFDFGDGALLSKVIEGTFPDYHRVIPAGNSKRLVVDREAFVGAVARCSVVGDRTRVIKMAMSADSGLVISRDDADHGSSREELDAQFDGAGEFAIGFNPRYLTSIAEQFDSESLIFMLEDAGSPTLVAAREGAIDRTVIMPLRL